MLFRNYPTPGRIFEEDQVNKWSRGRIIEFAKQLIGSPIDIDAIEIKIPFIVEY